MNECDQAREWLAEFVWRKDGGEPVELTLDDNHALVVGDSGVGLAHVALVVEYVAPDSTRPGRLGRVRHRRPMSPSSFVTRDSFHAAVRRLLHAVAAHEVDEFVEVAGQRIYDPHQPRT